MVEQVLSSLFILALLAIPLIQRFTVLANPEKLLANEIPTSCLSGKFIYSTLELAQQGEKDLLEKKGRLLISYQCSLCTYWHLTHKNKHERKRFHREREAAKLGGGSVLTAESLQALRNKYNHPK